MKITITSDAFPHGEAIPTQFTGEGADVSPPVEWSGVPDEATELALICDDPDAPTPQPWVHWVIYKIPAAVTGLPEGVPREAELASPAGARQGVNSWSSDNLGYCGPMPPPGHGTHHYHFQLYALDAELDLKGQATKQELLDAMQGHILAQGELMGTYERK